MGLLIVRSRCVRVNVRKMKGYDRGVKIYVRTIEAKHFFSLQF